MVQAVPSLSVDAFGQPAAAWITRLDRPLAGAARGALACLRFAAKDNIDVGGASPRTS